MVNLPVKFFIENKVNFGQENFSPSYRHPKKPFINLLKAAHTDNTAHTDNKYPFNFNFKRKSFPPNSWKLQNESRYTVGSTCPTSSEKGLLLLLRNS